MPLVITVMPQNPNDRTGWSNETAAWVCKKFKGDKFIKCIEKNSYPAQKTKLSFNKNNSVRVQNFYQNIHQALGQNLEIKPGIINYENPLYTLQIKMDSALQYFIYITDPKMNFIAFSSPDFIPRILLRWKPKDKERMLIFMKV